jgi:hypothetical protein
MNFETKYLIRWGIPGWVFLFLMFFSLIFAKDVSLSYLLKQGGTKSFSLIIGIAGLGVPIGYIFHHVNFGTSWIKKDKLTKNMKYITDLVEDFKRPDGWTGDKIEDYFYIEYIMQLELSKLNDSRMQYLAERYRHLLSTTHSLGALLQALFAATVFSIVFFLYSWEFWSITPAIVGMLMYISLLKNYYYYSENTLYFQGSLLNELFREKNLKERTGGEKE